MTTLTAELRQEIEKAGDQPVRIEDPETHARYVLLRAEVYDRLRPPPVPEDLLNIQVPEGIRRSSSLPARSAGTDDPEATTRPMALYHLEKRVGIGDPRWMERKIVKLGLNEDEYYASVIRPRSPEPEEIDRSFFEFDEVEPSS